MSDLRPCPFCGYPGKLKTGTFCGSPRYQVICSKCNATPGRFCKTEAEASEAWNTRAEITTIVGEVAWPGDSATLYVCKKCGGWTYTEDEPNFCSMCCAKVERIEKEGPR